MGTLPLVLVRLASSSCWSAMFFVCVLVDVCDRKCCVTVGGKLEVAACAPGVRVTL